MPVAVDILERKPGIFRLKIRVTGRLPRYATVRGSRAEAEVAAANLTAEVETHGLAPASPAMPFGGWVRQFISQQHHWSARSRAHYTRLVDLLIDPPLVLPNGRAIRAYNGVDPLFNLGRRAINRIQPVDCFAWQRAMIDGRRGGHTSSMTAAAMHLASRACVEAVKLRIIRSNPFADVRVAEPRRRAIKVPESDTLDRIVTAARASDHDNLPDAEWRAGRLGMLLHLALASGARRGELLALRWADVDHNDGTLRIRFTVEETPTGLALKEPKTASGNREIPIAGEVLDALRAWRGAAAEHAIAAGLRLADLPVLPDRDRISWWSPASASTAARRALHAAGIPVSLHALRHSFATELLRAQQPVAVVAGMLGHAKPEVTYKYYQHVMRGDGRAAAEARAAQIRGGVA